MHAPITLKDFIEPYQENRMTIIKQVNPKSKFRKFINHFLVDMLIFIAAILTVFLVLVIINVLMGQSKLNNMHFNNTLITTMALQRVRAMEALNTDRHVQNCNSGLLKILMILNLVIVVLLLLRKIKKSILFWGQSFSNMVKIKLFLADKKIICLIELNSFSWEYTFIQVNW